MNLRVQPARDRPNHLNHPNHPNHLNTAALIYESQGSSQTDAKLSISARGGFVNSQSAANLAAQVRSGCFFDRCFFHGSVPPLPPSLPWLDWYTFSTSQCPI